MLKGDALVTYLKEPSVDLACQILDGAPLRSVGPPLSVTVARFEMKGQQYQDKNGGGAGAKPAAAGKKAGKGGGRGGRGGGRGGRGGKKKQFSAAEKQARKLGWGGFDDVLPPERVRRCEQLVWLKSRALELWGGLAARRVPAQRGSSSGGTVTRMAARVCAAERASNPSRVVDVSIGGVGLGQLRAGLTA
eukprot:GHRQ01019653.1.p2 GENE.GHRQ01019653.1~~GHRQ01019653.1.p2  ORF type:complete len:191 (-),score=57.56 GHRQ01019653.1:1020-1592(-)